MTFIEEVVREYVILTVDLILPLRLKNRKILFEQHLEQYVKMCIPVIDG